MSNRQIHFLEAARILIHCLNRGIRIGGVVNLFSSHVFMVIETRLIALYHTRAINDTDPGISTRPVTEGTPFQIANRNRI